MVRAATRRHRATGPHQGLREGLTKIKDIGWAGAQFRRTRQRYSALLMASLHRQSASLVHPNGPVRESSARLQRDGWGAAGSPVRTVVVDDHPLFRRGARELLERSGIFHVVAEAGSGREGLELAFSLQPDLLLLDVRLGDMDGHEALRRLRAAGSAVRVAIITASRDPEDLQSALRAGADAYLLKSAEPHALLAQLRRVVDGQLVLAEGLGESLARSIRDDRGSEALARAGLTEREHRILECISAGYGNQRIAEVLDIPEATVKVHVKRLLKKLGLHSRVEAALWCLNQARRVGPSGYRAQSPGQWMDPALAERCPDPVPLR
jgi:two-component system, NarL family, nitrate/nitrite response regulator NarL